MVLLEAALTYETNPINSILPQLPAVYLAAQHGVAAQARPGLSSTVAELDAFLAGGLRYGELSEWGAPLGRGGRDVIARFLARKNSSDGPWSLWVCGKSEVDVYPPAWVARGVCLERVRFTHSERPVRDLKPVFFDRFFRVIVLDTPRHLTRDDCAFLAQRARANQQSIIIVRDYFLSEKRGNVWTKLRLNCWQDVANSQVFHLKVVRGLPPRRLRLNT